MLLNGCDKKGVVEGQKSGVTKICGISRQHSTWEMNGKIKT